ncbi:phage tail length tape measure family protein, partial [Patescibacteria group bacterium]|nr:phage tail length tape measure family protein [Patescibacteria group bacterium]
FATRAKAMLGSVMGMMGVGLGVTGLIYGAKRAIEAATEQEQAEKKLAGVLAATGNAAGFTGKQLQEYAADLQKVTNYGDEATISAMGILASFREIKGDQFKQATALALDLSAMLDTDLKSSVVMIGKALNDPTLGLTAMSRAGITFTDSQKAMIKTMQKSGDMLGAQTMILAELEHQFGGTAKAMADPMVMLNNRMGDLTELIGKQLKPAIVEMMSALVGGLESASTATGDLNAKTTTLAWTMGWLAEIVAAITLALRLSAAAAEDGLDHFRLLTASTDEMRVILARMAARAKEMREALIARSPTENMERLAKAIERSAAAGKGLVGTGAVIGDIGDEAEKAAKKISKGVESLAGVKLDILAFGEPGWFKEAVRMAGELGGENPLVAAFVAANQELDAMKEKAAAAAKDESLGQRIIEATRTPEEKLRQIMDDLRRLRDVGALGKPEAWSTQQTFVRAQAQALEDYEKAQEAAMPGAKAMIEQMRTPLEKYHQTMADIKRLESVGAFKGHEATAGRARAAALEEYRKELKPRQETELPKILERGTNEAWAAIVSKMYGRQQNKPAEETAKNTKVTADTLRQIYANPRQTEEVGI